MTLRMTRALITPLGILSVVLACSRRAEDCYWLSTCPQGGASGASGQAGQGTSEGGGGMSGEGPTGGVGESSGGAASGGGGAGVSGGSSSLGGEGGNSGSGGSSECDPTQNPADSPCLVTSEYAVFVSPEGDDKNSGSAEAPLATLSEAVKLASGDKLVIVCNDTYDEHVTLKEGARIYGGFSCAAGHWAPAKGSPVFAPSDAGPALAIQDVADELLIANVQFEASDAKHSGESSIAGFIANSKNVTLREVRLEAGKGADGANGTLTPFEFPERAELDGNSADGKNGGDAKVCECPGGATTSGGIGGDASPSGQNGGNGTPALGGGKGGTPGADCTTGGAGAKGADGPDADPAPGADKYGTLTASGWTPADGTDGPNGSPGQGGGGGASTATAGGGGGGCGGCGGAGAKAGQGGGASIALAVFQSTVNLEDSTLVAADAGDGGNGAKGQPGQAEAGVAGLQAAGACSGGNGGVGGHGAASGGGAGGLSVGILWKGKTAPTLTRTTPKFGMAGAKGAGGVPDVNDGIDGASKAELQID